MWFASTFYFSSLFIVKLGIFTLCERVFHVLSVSGYECGDGDLDASGLTGGDRCTMSRFIFAMGILRVLLRGDGSKL